LKSLRFEFTEIRNKLKEFLLLFFGKPLTTILWNIYINISEFLPRLAFIDFISSKAGSLLLKSQ